MAHSELSNTKVEYYTEERPWGYFTVLEDAFTYKVKKIVVSPRKRLSLQLHKHRAEQWTVVQGSPVLTCGTERKTFVVGDSLFIPKEAVHRIENDTDEDVAIIEVQIGEYLGEDDIVRLEDDYSRVNK